MKKFIIIVFAGFTFCLFTGLGLVILNTNSYGINYDTDGLLPKVEVTFIDEVNGVNVEDVKTYFYKEGKKVTVTNSTGRDLSVTILRDKDLKRNQIAYFYLDSNFTYVEAAGSEAIIHSLGDDFDEYFITHQPGITTSGNPQIFVEIATEDGTEAEFETEKIQIKAGESYEISVLK